MSAPPRIKITPARIERVAEALFMHRYGRIKGPWDRFKLGHPDIAAIYRENAEVALKADAGPLTESAS